FSTLDAICEVLDCQPGDILRHISVDKSRNFSRDAGGSIIVDEVLVNEDSGGGL
ncbi:helix-turn-helix domain-containing protein, partial [Gordonibacter sp.]